jgi:thiamine pyrophosphokinase
MLIKFANLRQETDLTAAASEIASHGRDSIQIASPMLRSGDDPAPEAKS